MPRSGPGAGEGWAHLDLVDVTIITFSRFFFCEVNLFLGDTMIEWG